MDITATECPDCGVQLNADGTVDALDGEEATHYADCTAAFLVVSYPKNGDSPTVHTGPGGQPWRHYGPARDFMNQRRAMSGPRLVWRIEPQPRP